MNWQADLEASRDVPDHSVKFYRFAVSWLDSWRIRNRLQPGRESARLWWKSEVLAKERKEWQLRTWAEAVRWYLQWLDRLQKKGISPISIPERVRDAVIRTGARRGLATSTRRTYAGWCTRFAEFAGDVDKVRDVSCASEWLGILVQEAQVSFATQKQALNALVFFFREVCGMEEVSLEVRLRKTTARVPTVLSKAEINAVLDHLEPKYRKVATLQYGAGLRLKELVSLRVKDLDFDRNQVVIRGGKGDRDRVTVLPEKAKAALLADWESLRELHERDRDGQLPGVWLPPSLARKFPKAGEEWGWFWIFPADQPSKDPESGLIRRHFLHPKVYFSHSPGGPKGRHFQAGDHTCPPPLIRDTYEVQETAYFKTQRYDLAGEVAPTFGASDLKSEESFISR